MNPKNNVSFWETVKYLFINKQLRVRFFYLLFFLFIFRFGANLVIPGVVFNSGSSDDSSTFVGLLSLLGGGGLKNFSIFSLGVSPYITSTIIMQLLSADVIPYLTKLNKAGEKGRKKIDLIARYLTIPLGILQAIAIVSAMVDSGSISFDDNVGGYFYIIGVMLSGSFFAMWLGDKITQKGIGNGTSMIIFSGIVANLFWNFSSLWNSVVGSISSISTQTFIGLLDYVFLILVFIFFLFANVYINLSYRKIPVQHVGSGLTLNESELSYLPLKVNSAGVVPVIFASAFLTIPLTISNLIDNEDIQKWFTLFFSLTSWIGLSIYFVLTVLFTFFYSRITVNPDQISENFEHNGSFFPGVQPGESTASYIKIILNRMDLIGGVILGFIAAFPYVINIVKGIPANIAIGGTSIIIMVGVALDTISQISGRVTLEKYSLLKNASRDKSKTFYLW